jgi:deoxyribonuclease V
MSGDPYRWPIFALELERLQTELAERWRTAPRCPVPAGRLHRIAGVFVAFGAGPRGREAGWAAAVVMEAGRVLAMAVVRGRAHAPYEPGHLALQRGPLLERAVRKLEVHPDVLLVNATGRDHPRRAGLALHLGAALDLPTVGVTDHPLVAAAGEPAPERGAVAPLMLDGDLVGLVLRTRRRARPVIVHAGWRSDPETARLFVVACTGRARTPEPLRLARFLARVERSHDEGRISAPPQPLTTILLPS